MPTFQVTARELAYVDRTYEVEAATAAEAKSKVEVERGYGECISQEVQFGYDFCRVLYACDANGKRS